MIAPSALAAEDAQQRILERHVEARRAGVALPPGAAAQLVVDAPRLVPLGADDVQAAGGDHRVVPPLPFLAQLRDLRVLLLGRELGVVAQHEDRRLDAAAQHDVGAAARHVGGDGDHLRPARLRDDLGLAGVLLGVQHLVRQLLLLEVLRQQLRVLDRRRAHQHRLPALVAVLDVGDDRVDLLLEGAEHEVVLVLAHHRLVRRDDHGLEVVDLLELEGLGVRRPGHAGELAVHPEVVLEGDRGERLVLALDRHAFLRLHRLVQAVGPAAAGHQPAGELVDDDDLAVLHHVLLVAQEQHVSLERRVEVVHQRDVVRVVEAGAGRQQARIGEDLLGVLVAFLGQQHLPPLLVDPEIAGALLLGLARELGHEVVEAVVERDVVLGLPRDDQRRARLVDQDRVDLVDDRVREPALHPLARLVDHVVAQVVEAELVVGAVGDVGGVGDLLLVVRHLRQVDADGEAEEPVDPAHPVGVALGEVVVDRHHVHALAGERVEIRGQRGDQRLALAGAHFRDLAVVQHHPADQLDVEVAHLQDPLAGLADDGERLGEQRVERFAALDALPERGGLRLQLVVGQRGDRRLEGVDLPDGLRVLLQQAFVAAAEDAGEDIGNHRGVRYGRRRRKDKG